MDESLYLEMSKIEDSHWWFAARRLIIYHIIKHYLNLPKNASILDAGCGTGGNLNLLRNFGKVTGMEMDNKALRLAKEKSMIPVMQGRIPNDIPFVDKSFDLIVLLDVLEHIDNDRHAIQKLARLLRPDGFFLITVPAFSFLWSKHDEKHHHKRRYRAYELAEKIKQSGLELNYISYYNFFLFPFIASLRILKSKLHLDEKLDDLRMPEKFLNQAFKTIFSAERFLLGSLKLPYGVSVIAVASKKYST